MTEPTDAWENLYLAAGSAENVLLVDFKSESLKPFWVTFDLFDRSFEVLEETLSRHRPAPADELEAVLAADAWARDEAERVIRAPATLG